MADLEQENAALHELIAAYKQAIYGQSSERVDPKQADLDLGDIDPMVPLPTPANDEDGQQGDDTPKAPRRGGQARRNRGALPRHLPRKHVHLEPETDTCPCRAGALHKIGEDIRELLDVVPALYRGVCIHRARYGCRTCSSALVQAPAPEQPVDGGYATCTLIAQIAVGKWAWHLPLYRQAKMLAGQGIAIDRSTLASWTARRSRSRTAWRTPAGSSTRCTPQKTGSPKKPARCFQTHRRGAPLRRVIGRSRAEQLPHFLLSDLSR